MHVTVKWFKDQFNVSLHAREGVEEFLTVKGCRIVAGKDGYFVGFPATKNETSGKWWTHVWSNEKFQAEVIRVANEAKPGGPAAKKPQASNDDIPF